MDSLSVEAIGMGTHYRPESMLAGFVYELQGDSASALKAFEEAALHLEREVEAQSDHVKRVASLGIAFDQLEILLSMPSWITIPLLKLEPRWAPLVEQARFQELERKYG